MKKLITLFFVLTILTASCAAPAKDPGVSVPDPNQNSLRLNGLLERDVYETEPQWINSGRFYQVICTIAPLSSFHVYERSRLYGMYNWRHVSSLDGTCDGWIYLP